MRNEQQEEFTFKRVQKFMIENRDLDANAFVQKLVDELEQFRGTEPPHDDTTMLVFKRVE
jgi:serine phosphatase RsbU (regulator of sigma subunit)